MGNEGIEIFGRAAESQITYISINDLYSHPDNPRKDLGDLAELSGSIRANGVLQNLTVVPLCADGIEIPGKYTVIIGHRRMAAAKMAGLDKLPCVITRMSEKEQARTMLMENMQRSDLTVYEQAQGFQMMIDLGESVEEVAAETGFSVSTVRRRIKMTELDQDILRNVSGRQIALTEFDRLSQIDDISSRNKCLEKIGTSDFDYSVKAAIREQKIKKYLPAVKEILERAGAKEVDHSEVYSSKYERIGGTIYIEDWDGEKELVPKGDFKKLFFYLDPKFGHLDFLKVKEKAKPVHKTLAEIEEQRAKAAAWQEVKEKHKIFYQLRSDFIATKSVGGVYMQRVLFGAVLTDTVSRLAYISRTTDSLFKVLDVNTTDDYIHREEAVVDRLLKLYYASDYETLLKLVYSLFGDRDTLTYCNGYEKDYPEYRKNTQLDALYQWLCLLGYEMSEEEQQFQDGTHPIFNRKQ